jgi:Carboxypeptidase regulatory-like domain
VAAAKIVFEGKNFRRVIYTDASGQYVFEAPAGVYRMSVKSPGFRPLRRKRLNLTSGVTLTRDFTLSVSEPAGILKIEAPKKND